MSSELMKKISGVLTDINNNPLSQLPFGITVEMTTTASPPASNPGGWIGSAPVKDAGQFDLFTAYSISTSESVSYKIYKDGQPVVSGTVLVSSFVTSIPVTDVNVAALKAPCDCDDDDSATNTKIYGWITNQNNKPISTVIAFRSVTVTGSTALGGTTSDNNGYYEHSYPRDPSRGVQLVVDLEGEIDPVESEIFYDSDSSIEANLTVPYYGSDYINAEYFSLLNAINSVKNINISSLPVDSYQMVAKLARQNELLVKMALLAQSFSQQIPSSNATMSPELYYGIMRTTMQESLEVILGLSRDELLQSLLLAGSINTISNYSEEDVSPWIDGLKAGAKQLILGTAGAPVASSQGVRILSSVLSGTVLSGFLDYYYANDTSSPNFWNSATIMAAVPGITTTMIGNLQAALSYALLTGNNPSMVSALLGRGGLEANVGLTNSDWSTLITSKVAAADFIFPDYITGASTAEMTANYADSLQANFDNSYRTLAAKKTIVADTSGAFPNLKTNLNQLLADHPTFDLLKSPTSQLTISSPPAYVTPALIAEISTVQRLNVVNPSISAIMAMKQNGIASSKDVIQLSKGDFVTTFSAAMGGGAQAALAYTTATNAVIISQAIAMNVYGNLNLTIPAMFTPDPDAQADWRSLFGSVDFCSCDSCLSVFSPSAYLVDSLELLRKNNPEAYTQLQARRPDLWDIDLTCQNTNTPLPYIDLVNELLEAMITYAVHVGSIYPYNLDTLDNNNTTLDAETLDAIPQYVNANLYSDTFLSAKYPWTAPYNYFHEQTDEYLNLVNIRPYKLPQAFSKISNAFTLQDIDLACAFLGITKLDNGSGDYYLITDTNAIAALGTYYGLPASISDPALRSNRIPTPPGDLMTYQVGGLTKPFLKRVDIFMQQSGLSFTDLLELLDCYYINPITGGTATSPTRRLTVDSTNGSICDTSSMIITNSNQADLVAIHAFTLLQRKTGWSRFEFDQVLTALNVAAGQTFNSSIITAIAQIKRLTEILNCSVTDILPFWGDIGDMAYREYGGDNPALIVTQYQDLFRNQTVVLNQSYLFAETVSAFKQAGLTAAITQSQTNATLAALQISERDFNTLFAFFRDATTSLNTVFAKTSNNEFIFNYQNVLHLLREVTLSKMLQIGIDEWCILRNWMADASMNASNVINPFNNGTINPANTIAQTASTISFIEKISRLRKSGLTTNTLNYVFNDLFVSDADRQVQQAALYAKYDALRTLLVKINTSVVSSTGTIDPVALLKKINLALDGDDADFMVNHVGQFLPADNTATAVSSFNKEEETRFFALLPNELTIDQKLDFASQLVGGTFSTNIIPIVSTGSTAFTESDVQNRLVLINKIFTHAALTGQVRSYMSSTYNVDLSVSDALLSRWIQVQSTTTLAAYDILLNEDYINSSDEIATADLLEPYTINVLQVMERFNKAAILANLSKLNGADIDFLSQNGALLGIPQVANLPSGNVWSSVTLGSTPTTVVKWTTLLDWLSVRNHINPSPSDIFSILQYVISSTLPAGSTSLADVKKQNWFTAFSVAMQMDPTDLEVLVGLQGDSSNATGAGILGMDFSGTNTPYLVPDNYKRIFACLDLQAELEVNMASCNNIAHSVLKAAVQTDADYVIQAVKARFSNEEWLSQVKPINDRLRTSRRDTLVAYLLAYPPVFYYTNWMTPNDIFESLLIDTQMMPIVKTSRIKQAISSIQLFIDRCTLQKEFVLTPAINPATTSATLSSTPITLTVESAAQWSQWRKWYGIWEANREIFVYPENWIEPDLRDDKSPFFEEVEKFIKQNEINADTMEDVYRTYLERLDEVSHLDVIGYYPEPILDSNNKVTDTIVHVWGRTKSSPQTYYYRNRTLGVWGAWTKMDTQIDGDNFAPVKWKGRLRLYWLTTMEQIIERPSQLDTGVEAEPPQKYLKISLCWTELKNGSWLPKQIGSDVLETSPYQASASGGVIYGAIRSGDWTNGRPYSINSFNDSFNYLKSSLIPYCRVNAEGELEIIVIGKRKYVSQKDYNNATTLKSAWAQIAQNAGYNTSTGSGPWPFYGFTAAGKDALQDVENYYFSNYKYEVYFNGRFTVKHKRIFADDTNLPYTYYDIIAGSPSLIPNQSQFQYALPKTSGYKHDYRKIAGLILSTKLLGLTPEFDGAPTAEKDVVFSRMTQAGSEGFFVFNQFFYKDYHNAFYVERMVVSNTTSGANAGSSSASTAPIFPPPFSGTALTTGGFVSSSSAPVQYTGGFTGLTGLNALNGGSSSGISVGNAAPVVLDDSEYYRFYPFYHYRVDDMLDQLDNEGLDGLFDWKFIYAGQNDELNFSNTYSPTVRVLQNLPLGSTNNVYPKSNFDFSADSPTAIYNWELFFHIPLLIANKLMQDQKFDDARKWFHYVFNPTNPAYIVGSANPVGDLSHTTGPGRFWQFWPFFQEASSGAATQSIDDIMNSPDLATAVARWANDPFKPHLVARTRISAYMKNVLMKYLDNLIAWGDQLFRQDTLESINEASLLYIMAAQILGRPAVKVPNRFKAAAESYSELLDNVNATPSSMNAFSNVLVAVETVLAPTGVVQNFSNSGSTTAGPTMMFFCIPPNAHLLSYWDLVADRLFKIHNSENIDGVERQLALFEPPIDPALLVRAAAAGLSLSDAVNELFAPMPQYRFAVMQQKASELVQEVKGLGSSLLSAIEKKDAEHLSLLRSSQEMNVMDNMREVKQYQLQEAQAQIAALQDQQDNTTIRRDYYSGLIETGLNVNEQSQLDSIQLSIPLKTSEGNHRTLAGELAILPDIKLGGPFTWGATFGGSTLSNVTNAIASSIGTTATINDIHGTMSGIKGGYARRTDDWNLQLKLANGELKQIEKQLIAAEIRASIAQTEMDIQSLQFNNSVALDAAMRDKYSNEDLYDWMISQISITYFQCYKLAFDLAKRAERCYCYELGVTPTTPFIQFGYWDSLKKGLLAGEGLSYDIKRMDASYMDLNKRQHEMTKHISLAALDPNILFSLKTLNPTTNAYSATFDMPEWLFDMDYPGHYFRRIKSVSVSIPCVAGPYTTVSAKLTLNKSRYRNSALRGDTGANYTDATNVGTGTTDPRFSYMTGGGQSIATSTAQNDAGMFELNFRDERYLPFEGAGVVGNWTLELPAKYASFDRNSISDVIIHIQYTAKYDGSLIPGANAALHTLITTAATGQKLPRLFNIQQEFSTEWNAYLNAVKSGSSSPVLSLPIQNSMFPIFCVGKTITVNDLIFKAFVKDSFASTDAINIISGTGSNAPKAQLTSTSYQATMNPSYNATIDGTVLDLTIQVGSGALTVDKLNNIDSICLAAIYTISS